jgi:hypothetical protein
MVIPVLEVVSKNADLKLKSMELIYLIYYCKIIVKFNNNIGLIRVPGYNSMKQTNVSGKISFVHVYHAII